MGDLLNKAMKSTPPTAPEPESEPEEAPDEPQTYFYRIVLKSGIPLVKPSEVPPEAMAGTWKHTRTKAEPISWAFDGWQTLASEIVDIAEASAAEVEAFEAQYGGEEEEDGEEEAEVAEKPIVAPVPAPVSTGFIPSDVKAEPAVS